MMKVILCVAAISSALLAQAAQPNVVVPMVAFPFFVDKNKDFCLVASGTESGAAVNVGPCTAESNWRVPNGGPGTGPIMTQDGNMCLDVPHGTNKNGVKLEIHPCTKNNKHQKWTISDDLTIKWAGSNKCLDNTGGSLSETGEQVQIWKCNKNINQKWVPGSFDPDGVFPGNEVNFAMVRKTGDTTFDFGCLTAPNGVDGGEVVFQTCDFDNLPPSQQWTLSGGAPPSTDPVKGNVGTLQVYGNYCLDVPHGNTANGVKLQVYTCGTDAPHQQWRVNGDGTIEWAGKKKCVDLTHGEQSDGNTVQTYSCSSTNRNQIWFVTLN